MDLPCILEENNLQMGVFTKLHRKRNECKYSSVELSRGFKENLPELETGVERH